MSDGGCHSHSLVPGPAAQGCWPCSLFGFILNLPPSVSHLPPSPHSGQAPSFSDTLFILFPVPECPSAPLHEVTMLAPQVSSQEPSLSPSGHLIPSCLDRGLPCSQHLHVPACSATLWLEVILVFSLQLLQTPFHCPNFIPELQILDSLTDGFPKVPSRLTTYASCLSAGCGSRAASP